MHEILFRGKRIDNGEWVNGDLIRSEGRTYCGIFAETLGEIDPDTVGQYTGLQDKNGKRIFEGDIVKYGCDLMVVVWQEDAARFALKFSADGTYSQSISRSNVYLEIIGNIHDNPDLIEGAKGE